MSDNQFWALIETALEAGSGNFENQFPHLKNALEALSTDDLLPGQPLGRCLPDEWQRK
jgi:hypothetical protein